MKTIASFVIVLLSGIFVGLMIGVKFTPEILQPETRVDTVYIERMANIDFVDSVVNVNDSLIVLLSEVNKSVMKVYDTIRDTVVMLNYIALPVTQKHYRFDSSDIWVSGYRPKIDSLKLRVRDIRTVEVVRERYRKKFEIEAGGGLMAASSMIIPHAEMSAAWLIRNQYRIRGEAGIMYSDKLMPYFDLKFYFVLK